MNWQALLIGVIAGSALTGLGMCLFAIMRVEAALREISDKLNK